MTGDRYAFRQRFNRWKQGERYWSIIGQPLPHYADGKDSDQEYYGYMERLANKKAGDWAQIPLRIDPDVTLTEMLNDNTYNYRTFYDNDRYLAEGMLYDNPYAHFSDTGKTVYHPTFSTDSNYSNRKSDYNPEGIEGGSWINNEYRVSRDQMNSKYFNPKRTLNYLKHSDPSVQMVLPQYRGGKNSKSSFVQQLETQPTVLQPAIQEWGDMWKERMEPTARSKVIQKWNATGRKPKPETSQEYTNRRIKETTERTWRSDAADIAHGIGEGVLALNPYTAIPYYGAKVGQDVLSGNVNWNTALNASVPLFHLSPQAVGLREAIKNRPEFTRTPRNAASITPESPLIASAVPDYSSGLGLDYSTFGRYINKDGSLREIHIPKTVTKSSNKNIEYSNVFKVDPDKRFMMFEPGSFINYDIGSMSIDDVVKTFGPEAEYYKKLYDVAKAHNFEGKYAQIGKDAEYNILNRFAINKSDPDVAKGIEEARRIYSIPEYRERFNKWGTLGDTFVDDAVARIDNVKLQGRSKKLDIKGQHGVHGSAYTTPDATTIGITNSESSSWITDMIRHETNHVGHGLKRQPDWMRYHNEKFRPIVREGKTTDTPLDKYYDEMNEIVERSKTAVEYADKIRKEGETLDQALTRLADMTEANIYNAEIPSDIRQSIARYTKDSMLNFWKNFVGAYVAPMGMGYGVYKKQKSGKIRPVKK